MASDMEPSDGEDDHHPVLGGSDDDDDEGHGPAGFCGSDDDDDDDDNAGFAPRGLAASDDEDEDEVVPGAEEDDDDDDDDEDSPADDGRGSSGFKQKGITQFFGAKGGASKAPKRTPVAAGPSRAAKGGGKKTFAMNEGSDDDDGSDAEQPVQPGGLVKKSLSLSAVDPLEEHDQLRRAHANGKLPQDEGEERNGGGGATEVPATVSDKVFETAFVLKNDKGPAARRFYGLFYDGMGGGKDGKTGSKPAHAPNFISNEECTFAVTVDQFLAPRKEREAVLTKLADERMSELIQEVQIWKVPIDPAGNSGGPGIVNVAGFLPCRVEDSAEALAAFHAKLPMDENPVFHLAVDEKLMKRVYKVGRSALPREYDPNAHGNVKYRVFAKMEDQEKIDEHVVLLAPPARSAAKRPKRPAENGGGADPKKKKAATPPPPPPAASGANGSGAPNNDDDDDDVDDGDGAPAVDASGPCFTRIKWTEIPSMKIEMAGIMCTPGQTVTLLPAGNGRYILVKTLA